MDHSVKNVAAPASLPPSDRISPDQAQRVLDQHHREWSRRAGQAAGFLYLAGDIAFMAHARRINNGGLDKLKMTRGLTYLVGSLILLNGNRSHTQPFSDHVQQQIKRQLEADIEQSQISPGTVEKATQWVKKELKQHPWEMAYLLFIAGSTMQGASALHQKRYTEAAATLGTIASILIPIAVPEGDQQPFIKLSDNMEKQGHHFADSYRHCKQAMPLLRPAFEMNDVILQQIRNHPLRVSAAVAIASNGLYGIEALKKSPIEKNLAMMAGLYLGANLLTAFASKNMDPASDTLPMEQHVDQLSEQMSAAYPSVGQGKAR